MEKVTPPFEYMELPMGVENRKHPRLRAAIPIRFNLDPDYHFVPRIKKAGVVGVVRNISSEGLGIDSEMDLLDVCQIFHESIEDDSVFGVKLVFTDPEGREIRIRGQVSWYQMSETKNDLQHFRAGLHLKDTKSHTLAMRIVESICRTLRPPQDYEDFLDLRDFRLVENTLRGSIKNTGKRTVNYLVIEARCLDNHGRGLQRKLYRAVPYGRTGKKLKPGAVLRVEAEGREIPLSTTDVEVNVQKLTLDPSIDA